MIKFTVKEFKQNRKKSKWCVVISGFQSSYNFNKIDNYIDPHSNKKIMAFGKTAYTFSNKTQAEEMCFRVTMMFS